MTLIYLDFKSILIFLIKIFIIPKIIHNNVWYKMSLILTVDVFLGFNLEFQNYNFLIQYNNLSIFIIFNIIILNTKILMN